MFPSTLSRETSELSGKQTNCSVPRDLTLSVYHFSKIDPISGKKFCLINHPLSIDFCVLRHEKSQTLTKGSHCIPCYLKMSSA